MPRCSRLIACGLLAATLLATTPGASAHGIDFTVAQNDGTEDAKLLFFKPDDVSEPYELPRIDSGQFAGSFASIEPGWNGLGVDQVDARRFALTGTNGVALQRVRFDSGFSMYTEEGEPILTQDGATHVFAGEPETDEFAWHQHLIFAAGSDTKPGDQLTATFRVTDPSGVRADSDEFTLTFQTSAPRWGVDIGSVGIVIGVVAVLAIVLGWKGRARG